MMSNKKIPIALFCLIVVAVVFMIYLVDQAESLGTASSDSPSLDSSTIVARDSGPDDQNVESPVFEDFPPLPLPLDDRDSVVIQRLHAGLSPRPPMRGVMQDLIEGKSTDELARLVSHPLLILGEGGGMAPNLVDTQYITHSLSTNPAVLELIERGRESPQVVSRVVLKEFSEDLAYWEEAVDARYQQALEGTLPSPKGFLTSSEGDIQGDEGDLRRFRMQYQIPASLFILANIQSSEAPIAARKLLDTYYAHPITHNYSGVNLDVAFFAVAAQNPRDPQWDRDDLIQLDRVSGPNAVMSHQDPTRFVIDPSLEPTVDLIVPNVDAFEPLEMIDRYRMYLELTGEN